MEALTATTIGLLTIWDMVKQYEKDEEGQYPTTKIEEVRVTKKTKDPTNRKML
jgi:cyclic pyranopterin phosphate synthase